MRQPQISFLGVSWTLIKTTAAQAIEDGVPRLSASLAFYGILSLAPMLFLLLSVVTVVFDAQTARDQIYTLVQHFAGQSEADTVRDLLMPKGDQSHAGLFMNAINFGILFVGASSVFSQLQDALNLIWKSQGRSGRPVIRVVKEKGLSFLLVLGAGILLVLSVILNIVLTVITKFATGVVPQIAQTAQVTGLLINVSILTLLFAFIFKVLPAQKILWRDVWAGALVTSVLFTVGQFVIGYYLGHSQMTSGYGAAGSLVALLIWIYYSSQICFLGAVFTHVYAYQCGSRKDSRGRNEDGTYKNRLEHKRV